MSLIETKIQAARTPKVCFGCKGEIIPDEIYALYVWKDVEITREPLCSCCHWAWERGEGIIPWTQGEIWKNRTENIDVDDACRAIEIEYQERREANADPKGD